MMWEEIGTRWISRGQKLKIHQTTRIKFCDNIKFFINIEYITQKIILSFKPKFKNSKERKIYMLTHLNAGAQKNIVLGPVKGEREEKK